VRSKPDGLLANHNPVCLNHNEVGKIRKRGVRSRARAAGGLFDPAMRFAPLLIPMAASRIDATQYFASVKPLCEHVEAAQVHDFRPQALIGETACHDQLRRERHFYQSIVQSFPVSIRQITLDDNYWGEFYF
jgi:hypothetical protein